MMIEAFRGSQGEATGLKAVFGIGAPVGGIYVSLQQVEIWLRLGSLAIGIFVGVATLISLCLTIREKLRGKKLPGVTSLLLVCLLGSGCTFWGKKSDKAQVKVDLNASAIAEESRALTTGIVDVLHEAPDGPEVDLAQRFAERDQQLEGTPLKRIDVAGLLTNDVQALKDLTARFKLQETLLVENLKLRQEKDKAQAELVAMGKLYEAERNKSIVKRFWLWATGTFGLLGGIAFVVFCPAIALPLLSQVLAFVVRRFPSLVSWFGVVAKGSFDAVVEGVGNVRKAYKEAPAVRKEIDTHLLIATDRPEKRLIEARRKALAV